MQHEQLSFAGFGRRLQPAVWSDKGLTDRYFFAIPVPPETQPAVGALTANLVAEHGLLGKPRPLRNLHATLFSLGDYGVQQPELVATARKFAATVQARPFPVTWDRVQSFARSEGAQPLVLRGAEGVQGLIGLEALFRIPMIERGIVTPSARKFTPHVTLLYDHRTVPEQAVAPLSWRATEFVLIHSLLGQSHHVVLGRWALRG